MATKYIKLATADPNYDRIINKCRSEFNAEHPDNLLSINVSRDGAFAWVKIASTTEIPERLQIAETKEQHRTRVLVDVNREDWQPPEPTRTRVRL